MSMGTISTKGLKTKTLLNRALHPKPIPSGIYMMIDTGSCPAGWTEDTNFDTRYPLGASTSIGTQAGSNTYSHYHSFAVWDRSPAGSTTAVSLPGNTGTSSATWYPPYVKLKFCKKD